MSEYSQHIQNQSIEILQKLESEIICYSGQPDDFTVSAPVLDEQQQMNWESRKHIRPMQSIVKTGATT